MLLRPEKKIGVLPFSDFEPLPLYNHVPLPAMEKVPVSHQTGHECLICLKCHLVQEMVASITLKTVIMEGIQHNTAIILFVQILHHT